MKLIGYALGILVCSVIALMMSNLMPAQALPYLTQPTPMVLSVRDDLNRRACVLILAEIPDSEASQGSGSVVDPRGYVLTNHHVVWSEIFDRYYDVIYIGVNGDRQDAPLSSGIRRRSLQATLSWT